MAVYFTGTSTGNTYQVGSSYTMGGDKYRANSDGSFTKEGSVKTLPGSSQSSSSQWSSDGKPSDQWVSGVRINTAGSVSSSSGGSGPGNGLVTTGGQLPGGAGGPGIAVTGPQRRATGLSITGAPWSKSENPPDVSYAGHDGFIPMAPTNMQPGRQLPFGPFPLEANPYFPPAQVLEDEVGEAEFLSPGWFMSWGKAAGDIYWNADRAGQYVTNTFFDSVEGALVRTQKEVNQGWVKPSTPMAPVGKPGSLNW